MSTTQTLTPAGYLPRVADDLIERYLGIFGAVEISGAKWCGKTWTGLHHARSVSYLDDDLAVAQADPRLMTMGETPHLIDEWQLEPRVWDAVRREVDKARGVRGSWILTGSSTPARLDDRFAAPAHSGAGRIGRVRMHPMSLFESGNSSGEVSLRRLFAGEFEPCRAPDNDTLRLIELVCRGGWPEAINLSASDAQVIAREYLRLFYTESMPAMGLDGDIAQRLVGSLARNLGQAATYRTLAADMWGEEESATVRTEQIATYLSALKASYVVDEVPGWVPQARSRKRLAVKPKRYLADPSLAVAQLGMGPESLVRDWQSFGLAFEALCLRDLMVYARALPDVGFEPLRYYRDDTGLEADAIVELADGRWAAFEVKTSEDKLDDAVASLTRLRRKLCLNGAARTREPEFMAVLLGVSGYAREVEDGIYAIPIRCLGA